ncbi:PEP-utilizing enzyme [Patescibacteria group bacterium]
MNQKIIKEVINKLPHETAQYAVRDITLLTCSIFCDTYITSIKKIFGVKHSINFWYSRRDGQVTFYRSGSELENLMEKTGERCLREADFAKKIAKKLIEMSDYINDFIKKNNSLDNLVDEWEHFWITYRDFFAYHQVVYWAGDYLTKLKIKDKKEKERIDGLVKILDDAYKYNEEVVPNVETYFIKLGIRDLIYTEVGKKNIKTVLKKRSILWLGREMLILPFKEASQIDKAITDAYKKYLKNIKQIKGLSVSKGVARGKVKLITDLNKLGECKKGDILVTSMTRPQYNTFIKQVRAIVTDEGGLLCHASMLAREFDMPCIVGTKNATKILKNDQLIEVDADKGIVKIIR